MSKKWLLSLCCVLAFAAVANMACGPTGEPTAAPAPEPTTPPEAAEESITLRVAIPQTAMLDVGPTDPAMGSLDEPLREALQSAAEQVGKEYGQAVQVIVESYVLPIHPSGIKCLSPAIDPYDQYDAVLIDSNSFLPAFPEGSLAPVNDGLFEDYLAGVDRTIDSAFPNPGGKLTGIVQATSPVMIIYRPDKIGAEDAARLQETLPLQELLGFINDHPVGLSSFPGIAIILLESTLPGLTFDLILDPAIVDSVPQVFLDTIDDVVASGLDTENLQLADQMQLAQMFKEGTIEWTMADSAFLNLLKQVGHDDPVAVARMPSFIGQGAGAMGVAWVVPDTSPNQELTWALLTHVVDSPGAIEWSLANGMLPASQYGFDEALSQGYDQQLLPTGLQPDDSGWYALRGIASESKIWLLPAGLSTQQYQELYQTANDLFVEIFTGELTTAEALQVWKDSLPTGP